MRNAKRKLLLESLQKPSPTLYKHLKVSLGSSTSNRTNLSWPAKSAAKAKASADMINEHFINSVNSIRNSFTTSNNQSDVKRSVLSNFAFKPISQSDILAALKGMATTSSSDADGITLKEFKLSFPEIFPVLATIFNLSLQTKSFPAQWKQALVTPIHKKGDVHEVSCTSSFL